MRQASSRLAERCWQRWWILGDLGTAMRWAPVTAAHVRAHTCVGCSISLSDGSANLRGFRVNHRSLKGGGGAGGGRGVYVSARTTSHCSVRYGRRLGKSTTSVSMNCGTPAAAAAASSSDPPAFRSGYLGRQEYLHYGPRVLSNKARGVHV